MIYTDNDIVKPHQDDTLIFGVRDSLSTIECGLVYDTVTSQYYAGFDDGTTVTKGATGTTIANAQVRLEYKVNFSANPWLCDVQVDGVALGQARDVDRP